MTKPAPLRYRTTNWSSYNRALIQRGSLRIWFDKEMEWHACASTKRGRPRQFSETAIQTCLTFKVLFGLPLRQTIGLVSSLLSLSGLDWIVPDYTTLCRRQKTLDVNIPFRSNDRGALHLLIDSTGIKMMGEGEWKRRKHGPSYRRQWRKLHIGVDAQTLDIRAIEVSDNRTGDAPVLPLLLNQIPQDEQLGTVSGDGAYDTRGCHDAIASRNASAVIPVRRNAKPWKETSPGAKARNDTLKVTRYLGRTIWKKWSRYHRRSLAETTMHRFKLLSDKVKARIFESQVTELKIGAAILNRFAMIGTPVTVRVP